jgi:hypothetical protein
MTAKHVVHFGVGTLAVCLLCVGLLGVCMIGAAGIVASHTAVELNVDGVRQGELGSLSKVITTSGLDPESKEAVEAYGPLNKNALAETKQGRLLDAIRARRGSSCQIQYREYAQLQSQRGYQQVPSYYSRSSLRVVSRGNGGLQYLNSGCDICPQQRQPNVQPIPQQTPRVQPSPIDVSPSAPRLPTPDIQSADDLPYLPDTADCPECQLYK